APQTRAVWFISPGWNVIVTNDLDVSYASGARPVQVAREPERTVIYVDQPRSVVLIIGAGVKIKRSRVSITGVNHAVCHVPHVWVSRIAQIMGKLVHEFSRLLRQIQFHILRS